MLEENFGYSQSELKKIGNTIIYLAERISDLSKTKLLKMVYLLDEHSVKSFGIPFLNLDYKVWQAGPVNIDLYSELSSQPVILKNFIDLKFTSTGETYISAKAKFDDAEFSDNEIVLLDKIIDTYGKLTANKLVDLCHRTNTLWYQIAKEKGVLEAFNEGKKNTSDYEIDLMDYIKSDKEKASTYIEHKEFLDFSKRFKA